MSKKKKKLFIFIPFRDGILAKSINNYDDKTLEIMILESQFVSHMHLNSNYTVILSF
jgi:hypothetical protein